LNSNKSEKILKQLPQEKKKDFSDDAQSDENKSYVSFRSALSGRFTYLFCRKKIPENNITFFTRSFLKVCHFF